MYRFLPRTVAYEACPSSFVTLETMACDPGEGDVGGRMYSTARRAEVRDSLAQGVTSRSSHVPICLRVQIIKIWK